MEGMLIHDDDRSRETERLVAELSSELCATDPDDLDPLIEAILPRIGEATRSDAVALIADGVGDSERRTYRYASAMDGADAETATSVPTPRSGNTWRWMPSRSCSSGFRPTCHRNR